MREPGRGAHAWGQVVACRCLPRVHERFCCCAPSRAGGDGDARTWMGLSAVPCRCMGAAMARGHRGQIQTALAREVVPYRMSGPAVMHDCATRPACRAPPHESTAHLPVSNLIPIRGSSPRRTCGWVLPGAAERSRAQRLWPGRRDARHRHRRITRLGGLRSGHRMDGTRRGGLSSGRVRDPPGCWHQFTRVTRARARTAVP